MGLILLTPPAEEPFDLSAAKVHLRETLASDQDSLINVLITASRERAETFTRKAFIRQSWRLTLDSFPSEPYIRIPMPPLISVESVKYIDLGGDLQTMDPADYAVDVGDVYGKIDLGYGLYWPYARCEANAVRIEFTCGFGNASDVPATIQAAMKLDIGNLFEQRESVNVGNIVSEIPGAAKSLLWLNRAPEFV